MVGDGGDVPSVRTIPGLRPTTRVALRPHRNCQATDGPTFHREPGWPSFARVHFTIRLTAGLHMAGACEFSARPCGAGRFIHAL